MIKYTIDVKLEKISELDGRSLNAIVDKVLTRKSLADVKENVEFSIEILSDTSGFYVMSKQEERARKKLYKKTKSMDLVLRKSKKQPS